VYRAALDKLLEQDGITDLSADEREELAQAWQRLIP
jgi:hypothetical protein